jgi:phosphate transport system substrate-binding protein
MTRSLLDYLPLALLAALALACFLGPRPLRGVARSLAAALAALALYLALWLAFIPALPEGAHSVLTVLVPALFLASCLRLVWGAAPLRKRLGAAALGLGAAAAVTLGVLLHQRLDESVPGIEAFEGRPGIDAYVPFRGGRLARLPGPGTLRLEGELPRLDGATALYPLYAAFAEASFPPGDYDPWEEPPGPVACSTTRRAFRRLLAGEADVAFLARVSEAQRGEAEGLGLALEATPVGREAFVFFVNARNPVLGLPLEAVRGIYSGEIANWRELGGPDWAIDAFQRAEGSGSQSALLRAMGGRPLMEPPSGRRFDPMGGIYDAVIDYKNYKGAIGFSFRHYLTGMRSGDGIRILGIDGVAPTPENIRSGAYPLSEEFHALRVRKGGPPSERDLNAARLVEWALSPQGQELVALTGYVPVRPGGAAGPPPAPGPAP